MEKTLLILLFTISLIACKKESFKPKAENIYELTSVHTAQKYEVKVLLPKDYNPNNNYPIVYLLDGYYHFADVSKSIKKDKNLNDIILVGIFYKDFPFSTNNLNQIEELRENDLTFPKNTEPSGEKTGGGAPEFYAFISTELIPFIENEFSVDSTERTLMGHSLGGYFVLWQMLEHEENSPFTNLVALSPSVWWSDLYLLQDENVAEDLYLPNRLYLGVAEHEGLEMNVLIENLNSQLIKHEEAQGLNILFERYSGGHLHSARKGFYNGLKYLNQ